MKMLGMLVVASGLLMACGSSDEGESSSGSSTPSPLSAAYQSNCQRCHGPVGEGKGSYPRIPNTKTTTEASFISQVRSGKGEMPAFAASQISDADLKADYLYLTTQR
jgi:mono/diheme cytochrome c family protein